MKTIQKYWWVGIVAVFLLLIIFGGDSSQNQTKTEDITINSFQETTEGPSHTPRYIYVKYRTGSVDINDPRWEYLDTSGSSVVRGAWYDDDNDYMIINLSGTNYHYCGLPGSTWNSFKGASSFGTYYNSSIKGRYDCRINPVPNY